MIATHLWILSIIALLLLPSLRGLLHHSTTSTDPLSARMFGTLGLVLTLLLSFAAYLYVMYTTLNSDFRFTYGRDESVYIRAMILRHGKIESTLVVNPPESTLAAIEKIGSWTRISRLEALKLYVENGLQGK